MHTSLYKYISGIGILLLWSGLSFKVSAQFSIRRNATNSRAVDILYKAPVSGQGVHPAQFFEFALQVPNPQGGTLTASFAPGPPLAALSGFQAYSGTDYGNTTFAWASTGVPNYSNTYNFPATEVVMGTVTFGPTANATGAIVNAVDYEDGLNYGSLYGGPGTGVAVWVLQVDPSGTDITSDLTNGYLDYSTLFYQSAASGITPGSALPFPTTENGGYTSYKVALSSSPLPVKMNSFTAIASQCDVSVEWTTAEEKDLDYFELQYSNDGTDYKALTKIAAGRKSTGSNYVYKNQQLRKIGYYRLKTVDLSGTYTYSKVITAYTACDAVATEWHLYPNPAIVDNIVHVSLFNATRIQNAHVIVTDLTGRKLTDKQFAVSEGTNVLTLPTTWMPGTYFVTVLGDSGMLIGTAQKLTIE